MPFGAKTRATELLKWGGVKQRVTDYRKTCSGVDQRKKCTGKEVWHKCPIVKENIHEKLFTETKYS